MNMHYGIARVEFLAAKQEIETMISEGYTFAMIFRNLIKNFIIFTKKLDKSCNQLVEI